MSDAIEVLKDAGAGPTVVYVSSSRGLLLDQSMTFHFGNCIGYISTPFFRLRSTSCMAWNLVKKKS